MFNLGKNLKEITVVGLAATIAIVGAGCRGKDKTPAEAVWIQHYRKEMYKVRTELKVFQEKYIRNNADPFELKKEIIPAIQSGKELTKYQKARFKQALEDYQMSWPMLTEQHQRSQIIFSVASALPAVQVYELLAKKDTFAADKEAADLVMKLKAALENGVVFNSQTMVLQIIPTAKPEVIDLTNKLATRMLSLMFAMSASERTGDLETKYQTIRLLNPQAALKMSLPLAESDAPFIDDPLKTWESLSKVYEELFAVLGAENVLTQKDKVTELLVKEKELVSKLYFATTKQFDVTEKIIKK